MNYKALRVTAVSIRIGLLNLAFWGLGGCVSSSAQLDKLQAWESFRPRNMYVRNAGLYENIETRIRQRGAATIECKLNGCSTHLQTGLYFVERFGFRTTTVIQNEYPIYKAQYHVENGLRIGHSKNYAGKKYEKTVAFVGDSNTWGEGHEFEDTFIGLLTQKFPAFKFINLSRCPFKEDCQVPEKLHFDQSSRPTLLIVPVFDSTSAENRNRAKRLAGSVGVAVKFIDFGKSDLERATGGRYVDYPTRLLSKFGHALVAEELEKVISLEGE